MALVDAHELNYAPNRFNGNPANGLTMQVTLGNTPNDEELKHIMEGLMGKVIEQILGDVRLKDAMCADGWDLSEEELVKNFKIGWRDADDSMKELCLKWSQTPQGYFKGCLFALRDGAVADQQGQPPLIHPEGDMNSKGEWIDGTYQLGHLYIHCAEKALGFTWETVHMRLYLPIQVHGEGKEDRRAKRLVYLLF